MADISAPISERLKRFFVDIGRRRWQPGVLDCGILVADWAVARGFADPIADLRGQYDSERQFRRIIRREGELLDCAAARLSRIGLVAAPHPRAGDILIVNAPCGLKRGQLQRRPTCAIAVDGIRRAVVTSDRGMVLTHDVALPTLAVWSFGETDA